MTTTTTLVVVVVVVVEETTAVAVAAADTGRSCSVLTPYPSTASRCRGEMYRTRYHRTYHTTDVLLLLVSCTITDAVIIIVNITVTTSSY
jgi:hypothetical protein